MRDKFIDPKTAKEYEWPISHEDDDEFGKRRNIQHGANTAGTGLVKQQADDQPLVMQLRGKILERAMLEEMWAWWQLCRTQTINFRDFEGAEYEVLFTEFLPTRRRAVRNPRDPTNAPHHFWEYQVSFEVVRIISGPLTGVSP